VNNEWRESQTTKPYMPVTDSSTGAVIAEAPCCTVDEVNSAVAVAKAAFPGWSTTPVQNRTAVMFRFRALLDSHLEELALSVSTELGKNVEEARGDIIKAREVVEMACGAPILIQGDSLMNVSTGHDAVMYREPIGVFAGIVPFNFPAMIPLWKIGPALSSGNAMILKPSERVPSTSISSRRLVIVPNAP